MMKKAVVNDYSRNMESYRKNIQFPLYVTRCGDSNLASLCIGMHI